MAILLSSDAVRHGTIDSSECPGTTSNPSPHVAPPAEAGTLHTPKSTGFPFTGSVCAQSSQNAVPLASPTTPWQWLQLASRYDLPRSDAEPPPNGSTSVSRPLAGGGVTSKSPSDAR